MAVTFQPVMRSLEAAADLSTKQYYWVKLDSNGKAVVAGNGEAAYGVLQNKPKSGETALVCVGGQCPALAGGSIDAGALIACDASGKSKAAVAATTNTSDAGAAADALVGSFGLGYAVEAGTNGALLTVEVQKMGAVPTTAG